MSKKFDRLLERATDGTLLDPAWENILICVDSVKSGEISPSIAISSIRKRYRNENPHVSHHALMVLEALVKNCGEKLHKEIACQEFMQDLKRLLEEKQAEKIKEKILQLIQCWAHAFRDKSEYKIVVDTHNLMKLEGYSFPPMRESDAMFDAESAPDWFDGDKCHRCNVDFGLFTRKHHCRNCGQVFCDKCSGRNISLPHIGIESDVRVCEPCFDKIKTKATSTAASSSSKNDISSTTKVLKDKDLDTKGPSTLKNGKAESEVREEEEFQLALAISQSEADEKERQKQRQLLSFYGEAFTTEVPSNKNKALTESVDQKNSSDYMGALDKTVSLNSNVTDSNEVDGELAKYLNRGYWEARRTEQKRGILRQSPTPSAPPAAAHCEQETCEILLNGKGSENDPLDSSCNVGGTGSPELVDFMEKLRSGVEVFVNRIRNDVARGRPVITDSSVQSMFVNLTALHTQLLQHMSALEDQRGFYESLQDKVAQIKDAREAMDALREEHAEKRQFEILELQRQQQMQMAVKLDVMRQKKHEMLEQQRLLAMQRIEEQRREMEARRQAQIHHQQQLFMMSAAPGTQQPPPHTLVGQEAALTTMHQMASAVPVTQPPNYPVGDSSSMSHQQPTPAFVNQYSVAQAAPHQHQQTFLHNIPAFPTSESMTRQLNQPPGSVAQQPVYSQPYVAPAVPFTSNGSGHVPPLQYAQYGLNLPPTQQQQFQAPQAPYYYQQPDPRAVMPPVSMSPGSAPYAFPSYAAPQMPSFSTPFVYYQQQSPSSLAAGVVPAPPADQGAQQVSSSASEGQLISFD